MKSMLVCSVVALLWVPALVSSELLPEYIDCPKPQAGLFDFLMPWRPQARIDGDRICCTTPELPKGCECFDVSKDSGYNKDVLPQCPEDIHVQFFIYTRTNKEDGLMISAIDQSVAHSNFDPAKPTKFVIHGYMEWAPNPWTLLIKNQLLIKGDFNVILVNWHDGAIGFNFNYWKATSNARVAGGVFGNMISFLKNEHGLKLKDVHIIGHSMGGQVSGYAAKEVFRMEGEKVGRVTGMDPAQHGFEEYPVRAHLDKEDATFVDIIHTDTVSPGLGMKASHGHVDFYAAGASLQPGCPANPINFEQFLVFAPGILESLCSHQRAYLLFASSINDCKFKPKGKSDCLMGYDAKPDVCKKGDYQVDTTAVDPFC